MKRKLSGDGCCDHHRSRAFVERKPAPHWMRGGYRLARGRRNASERERLEPPFQFNRNRKALASLSCYDYSQNGANCGTANRTARPTFRPATGRCRLFVARSRAEDDEVSRPMSNRDHKPIFGSGIRKGFLITVGIGIGLLYSRFSAGLEDWESIWVSSDLHGGPTRLWWSLRRLGWKDGNETAPADFQCQAHHGDSLFPSHSAQRSACRRLRRRARRRVPQHQERRTLTSAGPAWLENALTLHLNFHLTR